MRLALAALIGYVTVQAGVLPTFHREPSTLQAFQEYIAAFENANAGGKHWIDASGKRKQFEAGAPIVEARRNEDIPKGSLHHYSGSIRVNSATIEHIRKVMQDYKNYPRYFKPDVGEGSGVLQSDSTPADEHFSTLLTLVQSTLWIDVTYETAYDTHYRRLDKDRWTARSTSTSIKERLDPQDARKGYYPDGDDHGFLWRTHTYWSALQRDGGLDLQVDSISVSRPAPMGFGWWGNRRTRDAVNKMLTDTKTAIESVR